jgi:signal transduction histidine kinase/CheY-like chemotaxis protein
MNRSSLATSRQPVSAQHEAGVETNSRLHHRFLLWLASQAGGVEMQKPWWVRYGTAIAALLIATFTRFLLDPLLGDRAAYGFPLIAVIYVAWHAGLGPSLLAVVLGTMLGRYFFDPPRGSLGITESNHVSLLMSVTVGIVAVFFCELLRITARENRRLYKLARESEARKDAFLATLAHELRNPLTPIRNAIYLLEREHSGDSRIGELQQMMDRHTTHLTRLVNELLDVSRITQRKIELKRERIELQSIINGAVEVVQPLITEKRQKLQIKAPAQVVYLEADGVRLTQVVTNLLHNSAKYTETEGRLWLAAEVEGQDVVIRVRDTGVGIAPDSCERIFGLFEQAHQEIEFSQGGLGIGLTLVRELVHLHGGTVEARSAGLGLGSEFIVRLPIVVAVREISRPEVVGTEKFGESLRILVVDDSPGVARSLELVLLDWKHEVRTCADGFAALEAARTFQPDYVLADLGMPRMNGYQLAEELRRMPGMNDVVLIAVSGYGQEADKQRSLAVGFSRHLTKPVDLVELKEVLMDHRLAAG